MNSKNYKSITYFHKLRFTISKFRFKESTLDVRSFVKDGSPVRPILLQVLVLLGRKITPNWVRIIKSYLKLVNLLFKCGGKPMVVKYLKVASTIIQQVSAGYHIKDTTSLGARIARTKKGLPRFIPKEQRQLILTGDKFLIKFWLTITSIFRDIHFSGLLKLSTITQISSASNFFDFTIYYQPFADLFCKDGFKL